MTVRSKRPTRRDWIGLQEASELLGISPTTLRRWSDSGMIKTFVTPGGHRRFPRDAVIALLPSNGHRPTMDRLGETPARMQRVYRQAGVGSGAPLPWVASLDDEQRAMFRGHGLVIATALLAALDAPDEQSRAAHLAAATEASSKYGAAAATTGLPASVVVEAFLRFRRPFLFELSELGRRRGLDTTAATGLLDRATDAFDEMLVATVGSLERTVAERRRARRAARLNATSAIPVVADLGLPETPR